MSTTVSTILSLVGSSPLGLFTAHQWYSDYPTNSDATFSGTGYFSGGDLPFGIIYEVHSTPTATPVRWNQSIVFSSAWAHIVNNARILGGYSSALPIEEFFLNRPRGLLRFGEPSTPSIDVETVDGAFLELWGLYIDIPLVSITQPTWNATGASGNDLTPYASGAVHGPFTDAGTVALGANTIGVQVSVTTIPPYAGESAGEPVTWFDLGWIRWGDGFGYREREFISAALFQSFPRAPAYAPAIGYSLRPGVEISITELLDRRPPVEGSVS